MLNIYSSAKYALFTLILSCYFIPSFAGGKDKIRAKEVKKFTPINPENVKIVRDKWGVPHIYGKTDAEVAYGLAWANAEDDFATMQELFLAGKGMSGKHLGKDGAKRDFFYHAIGAKKVVDANYDTQISEEYKRYLEGYAQGLNAYAKKFPKEVLVKGSLPVHPKDVIQSFIMAFSLISGASGPVGNIIEGKFDSKEVDFLGSNALAFNSHKTADGSTILVINPHQPVEGPFSFYEAHLCSEEGLNVLGAMFPGGTSVFLGSNENLGWAHTYNNLDLVDVFKLEKHPTEKLTYKFDNEWLKLEKNKFTLKVKIKKWLTVPVSKTTYYSKYGTTIQSKDGNFYAVKFGANEKIGAGEQWYRMNKAKNYTEFTNAVKMEQLPRFNIMYADRHDTIFFINNGLVPIRDTSYNWKEIVPGNKSKTLWTKYHTFKDRPKYLNPECGYIFNTNNTPFNHTCAAENLPDKGFAKYWGFDEGDNNRAERFMELLKNYERVTVEDVKRIKFDSQYPSSSAFLNSLKKFRNFDPAKYPEVAKSLEVLNKWNLSADKDNENAGIYLLTFTYIFNKLGVGDANFKKPMALNDDLFLEGVKQAQEKLLKYFNTLTVPLGQLQRHVRGDKDFPLSGFPDALAANYTVPYKDGKYKPWVADSYVQIARFTKTGEVELETLHPFGASNRPTSPHYTDQMEIYSKQQTKKMTLNKEKIFAEAERIYSPK